MRRTLFLSLFGPLRVPFFVPAKISTAIARSRGQGRPLGRRATRASLDGGEHGCTLKTGGNLSKLSRAVLAGLATVSFAALLGLSSGSVACGAEPAPIAAVVDEASARFGLPAAWIYAVIVAESGGDDRAVSPRGAMGLMQLMPQTWIALSARHQLGPDPFDRRGNVLAGAAYLRQLHEQFGPRGFLAAYNAGPSRYADVLSGRRKLPSETIAYVARVERLIQARAGRRSHFSASPLNDWRSSPLFVTSPGGDGDDADVSLHPAPQEGANP